MSTINNGLWDDDMGKSFAKIGKKVYQFDFKQEKKIYRYLCCLKSRGLEANLKFDTYKSWKNYVQKKYQNEETDKLKEFSRYLNYLIRSRKPSNKFMSICITATTTWLLSGTMNAICEIYAKGQGESLIVNVVVYMITTLIMLIGLVYTLNKIVNPLYDNNLDEGLVFHPLINSTF